MAEEGQVWELEKPPEAASPGKQGPQTWELEKGPGEMPLADVLVNAVKNAPSSLYGVGESMVQPILHPIDTAKSIGALGKGLYSKAEGTIVSQDPVKKAEDEAVVNAMGEHFAERYGGYGNIKRTFRKTRRVSLLTFQHRLPLAAGWLQGSPVLRAKRALLRERSERQ